jgi:hypothetical protein
MLSPLKRVLAENKALVVKMIEDNATNAIAKLNHQLLCDVETLLGLSCVLPLLEIVVGLSKFAQGWHTFICDFVFVVKLVKMDLFTMYYDTNKSYVASHFSTFLNLIEDINEAFHLTWWTEPISQVEFATFLFRR